MVIESVTIEDKTQSQLVVLPAGCSVLAAKGGDGIITLHVKSNRKETRCAEHMFLVVKNHEEVDCIPGEYIDTVTMEGDGSSRHIFGGVAPTVSQGDFCYINGQTACSKN